METDFFFLFHTLLDSFITTMFTTLINSHFSLLDDIFLTLFFNGILTLYDSFIYDIFVYINAMLGSVYFEFILSNSDYILFYTTLENDYSLIISGWWGYLTRSFFYLNTVLYYDTYVATLYVSYLDYLIYLKWFAIFIFYLFILSTLLRFANFPGSYNYLITRAVLFLTSLGFENRVQFDSILVFLLFILFV